MYFYDFQLYCLENGKKETQQSQLNLVALQIQSNFIAFDDLQFAFFVYMAKCFFR